MVSRALRIFGLLLLVSGTAAANGEGRPLRWAAAERSVAGSDWAKQLGARASVQRVSAASSERHVQHRDATGRVWSSVELGASGGGSAAGWTTQRFGSWSYSHSSDGTSCFSQRTAESVLISCQ